MAFSTTTPCPCEFKGRKCVYVAGHESSQVAPLHFNADVGFWHSMDSMQLGEELINTLAQNTDRALIPHEWACIALAALDQSGAPRRSTEQLRKMLQELGHNV
jgi:hypothetical protein